MFSGRVALFVGTFTVLDNENTIGTGWVRAVEPNGLACAGPCHLLSKSKMIPWPAIVFSAFCVTSSVINIAIESRTPLGRDFRCGLVEQLKLEITSSMITGKEIPVHSVPNPLAIICGRGLCRFKARGSFMVIGWPRFESGTTSARSADDQQNIVSSQKPPLSQLFHNAILLKARETSYVNHEPITRDHSLEAT
jgi:hypothetical protein